MGKTWSTFSKICISNNNLKLKKKNSQKEFFLIYFSKFAHKIVRINVSLVFLMTLENA
jgi:hypothetical protein